MPTVWLRKLKGLSVGRQTSQEPVAVIRIEITSVLTANMRER